MDPPLPVVANKLAVSPARPIGALSIVNASCNGTNGIKLLVVVVVVVVATVPFFPAAVRK